MRIFLNGKAHEVTAKDLAEALDALCYRDAVVATAVNGRFVPVSERRAQVLADGDEIEVVAPMQGG
jgi:sulfur carrier protein